MSHSSYPPVPEFQEEIASSFAALLVWIEQDQGAPMFAADLAEGGCTSDDLREMAARWRSGEFDPADGADLMEAFAEAIATLTAGNLHPA